jgi:hypothetical protein
MRVINLGCANGWSKTTRDRYTELEGLKIDGSSSSRNLGNCYNEYSFWITQEGEKVNVVYTVDSSD